MDTKHRGFKVGDVMLGYCELCRAEEIKRGHKDENPTPWEHGDACKAAGCQHPYFYVKAKGGKMIALSPRKRVE